MSAWVKGVGAPSLMRGVCLLGVLMASSISCAPERPVVDYDAMFAEAEILVLDAEWYKAHNLLREFLKANPNHPGAHFYLGRSYLFLEDDFRPRIAEGELQTALALYNENGGEFYIERFTSPNYFPMMCNIESAKVSMREHALLINFDMPPEFLADTVVRARYYTEEARKISPHSADVAVFDRIVTQMEEMNTPVPSFTGENRINVL